MEPLTNVPLLSFVLESICLPSPSEHRLAGSTLTGLFCCLVLFRHAVSTIRSFERDVSMYYRCRFFFFSFFMDTDCSRQASEEQADVMIADRGMSTIWVMLDRGGSNMN
jgi:hypothetical protein